MKREPAYSIIKYLGGAKRVAAIVSKHPSRIYKWPTSLDKPEGMGGIVPARDAMKLLTYCQQNGIDLRPEDFFCADRLKTLLQRSENQEHAA